MFPLDVLFRNLSAPQLTIHKHSVDLDLTIVYFGENSIISHSVPASLSKALHHEAQNNVDVDVRLIS